MSEPHNNKKHVLVRYGELTLKGANRKLFVDKLIRNIKFRFKSVAYDVEFIKDHNSLLLGIDSSSLDDVLVRLQTVFGIYSLSVVSYTPRDVESIINEVVAIAASSPKKRFKLEVARKDKGFILNSTEIKQQVAPAVLRTVPGLIVDVHNPDLKIEIVVKKDHVEIFDTRIDALKGLPVGTSGRGLSLISGGIDSPVASFLTMKRGMEVDFLHFMTPPHTTPEAVKKVFQLIEQVGKYNSQSFNLFVCDFGLLLQELNHIPDQAYKITLMRRMFMRIANQVAQKFHTKALITGENLGQVASQTIESMGVINSTSELPILRPLVTYDKEEIIKVAKLIGTYETSILPFDDVCSLFVPKNPIIKPQQKNVERQEAAIMWQDLLQHTVDNLIERYIYNPTEHKLEKYVEKP